MPEKNVSTKLREGATVPRWLAAIPYASFARISTLFKPFIEFIIIAKTSPFSAVFAYGDVVHAPISHNK